MRNAMWLSRHQLNAVSFAGKSDTGYLSGLHLIAPATIQATDGVVAITVEQTDPVPPLSEPFPSTTIPLAAATAALKALPKKDPRCCVTADSSGELVLTTTDALATIRAEPVQGREYPSFDKLAPVGEGKVSVTLCAHRLAAIAKYAQSFSTRTGVGITFTIHGPDVPVQFKWIRDSHDVKGFIMPMTKDY